MSRSVFSGPPVPGEDDLCACCWRPRHEHCVFTEIKKPEGCLCDPQDGWATAIIPPVCDKFTGDPDEYCEKCEHEFKCHAK